MIRNEEMMKERFVVYVWRLYSVYEFCGLCKYSLQELPEFL